jgi:uroporphyrinogen-III decarboxylase
MNKNSLDLMQLLNGERVRKPPFWEVWFCMWDFCQRHYGDYSKIESRIRMAESLGMAAVNLGGISTNTAFGSSEIASDGTGHYSGGKLTSREQLEEKEEPDWDAVLSRLKPEREKVRQAGYACWVTLPWCFHSVATSMGLENFALMLYDDFDFIDEAFEWVEQRNRQAIEKVISEIQPDFILFDGDCAYKTGTMVKPEVLRKLTFDKTERTVAPLREMDIPYTFHTDGKLDDVIPMLIELGFAAVHGCEKAANDLDHLVETFGEDIALVGNFDVVFLANATPEQVREETRRMLESGSRKERFIAACNTSPQDYIPDENYFAFAEAIREWSR